MDAKKNNSRVEARGRAVSLKLLIQELVLVKIKSYNLVE
jgi:hypothetical protein